MRRAVRSLGFLVLLLVVPSCASGQAQRPGEDCTTELGIHIDPRAVTLAVGQQVRLAVETSTCGGSIRGTPDGLGFDSLDSTIARVNSAGQITGVAPGETAVEVRSTEFGMLGTVLVEVVR